MYKSIEELIESLPEFQYDIDALLLDYSNNNLDLDSPDLSCYECVNIVYESILNGQLTQAHDQYRRYGLTIESVIDIIPNDKLRYIID